MALMIDRVLPGYLRSRILQLKVAYNKRWPRQSFTRLQHTEYTKTPPYSARRYSLFSPTMIVLGTIPIFTFALGTWQVQRLKWKVSLIDELTEKLEREPIVLPNKVKCVLNCVIRCLQHTLHSPVSISAIPEFIYRKVVLTGKWDHARSMLLGPRVRDGANGYHIITPFIRLNGTTVLIDRGFISQEFADTIRRTSEVDGEEVTISGMLRDSQARNRFTPDNHPEVNQWYWADVDAMAEYAGGATDNVQPVFIEQLFGTPSELSPQWRC
jgi:surfeit locus 1 family protein